MVSNNSGKGDHFPIPKRHGGKTTVPCCLSCHDMKDRFSLDKWPEEWMMKVVEEFPKHSRETKIFLAKAISLLSDAIHKLKD